MTGRKSLKGRRWVHAFTLVELLAVTAILAILIALVMLGAGSVKATAGKAQCISNLRQIGTGLAAYLVDNNGIYPRYYGNSYVQNQDGSISKVADAPWNSILINGGYVKELKSFICPAAGGTAPISQVALGNISYGINMALTFNYPDAADWWGLPARITEVSSQTIVAGDAATSGRGDDGYFYGSYYMYPFPYTSPGGGQAWPRHTGACNILWGDGHVSTVAAPDPKAPESLYNPEALGRIYDAPKHWLRGSSTYLQ